ncbi:hypothetical protein DIPPA_26078 [Diplonema papillatum]|nr:hypothetical protein DIPPA_26078 [Diplonema papillatum]
MDPAPEDDIGYREAEARYRVQSLTQGEVRAGRAACGPGRWEGLPPVERWAAVQALRASGRHQKGAGDDGGLAADFEFRGQGRGTLQTHDAAIFDAAVARLVEKAAPRAFPPAGGVPAVPFETFEGIARAVFPDISADGVGFVWDEIVACPPTRALPCATVNAANLMEVPSDVAKLALAVEVGQMLELLGLHHAMQPAKLLACIEQATFAYARAAAANAESRDAPLSPQARVRRAERLRDKALWALQALDVENKLVESEILSLGGVLPGARSLEDAVDGFWSLPDAAFAYTSSEPVDKFVLLADMVLPHLMHEESRSLWDDEVAECMAAGLDFTVDGHGGGHAQQPRDFSRSDETTVAVNLLRMHGDYGEGSERELSESVVRVTAIFNKLAKQKAEPDEPVPRSPRKKGRRSSATPQPRPAAAPGRRTVATLVADLSSELAQIQERRFEAAARNHDLIDARDALVARQAMEASFNREESEPDHPPPEIPEHLWVSVEGGWVDIRGDGRVRPGPFGPQGKAAGMYTRVTEPDNVETPMWVRTIEPYACIVNRPETGTWVICERGTAVEKPKPETQRKASVASDGEETARSTAGESLEIVSITHDDVELLVVAMSVPHLGWMPHELDDRHLPADGGAQPWQPRPAVWRAALDASNTWEVVVSAAPLAPPDEPQVLGLCRVCKPHVETYRTVASEREYENQYVKQELHGIRAAIAQEGEDMQHLVDSIAVYQDSVEAPPLDPRVVSWGTNGAYDSIIAPMWTGGRPYDHASRPYEEKYHRLPVPRGPPSLPTDSRMPALSAQLATFKNHAFADDAFPAPVRPVNPENLALRRAHPLPSLSSQVPWIRPRDEAPAARFRPELPSSSKPTSIRRVTIVDPRLSGMTPRPTRSLPGPQHQSPSRTTASKYLSTSLQELSV